MNQNRSGWALEVGSVAGIAIRVHVTFLVLFAWLIFASGVLDPIREALFIGAVFGCVLAHELGHCLVAKRFGIKTRDITLYPFGGIAAILAQPTARAELAIAIAGPLVNVVIAAALYPFIELPQADAIKDVALGFRERLFLTNIGLALFNLLPALPMDGGRVLRAILALINVSQPTMVAARISKFICLILAIIAFQIAQPLLFVVAFIIFVGAVQEHVRAEGRTIAVAFTAADVMVPQARLESLPHGTTISKALRIALTSLEPLYPIMNGDELVGILFRDDILDHAATKPDEYVSAIVTRSIPSVEAVAPLSDAIAALEETGSSVIVVTREGVFAGLLVNDRVSDFLLLQGIRNTLPKDDDAQWSTPL